MNADSITYVLEELGSPRVKQQGPNVMASCPLAPWTHGSGADGTMKLGVKVTQGISPANCFYPGCFHGTLMGLVDRVAAKKVAAGEWEVGGEESSNLKAFILMAEEDDAAAPEAQDAAPAPIPDDVLALVGTGSPYWESRGLSPATIAAWRIGEGKGRAVIPVIDRDGQVVAVKGRILPGYDEDDFGISKDAKFYTWPPRFKKVEHLAGEHLITKPVDFLLVVESEADAAMLNEWLADREFVDALPYGSATDGAVAVATMGADMKLDTGRLHPQLAKLVDLVAPSGEIALGFDSDNPGRLASRKVSEALAQFVPRVTEVEWVGKDPLDADDGQDGTLTTAQVRARALAALRGREDWFERRLKAALSKNQ